MCAKLLVLVLLCCAAAATLARAEPPLADLTIYDRTERRELPIVWHEGRRFLEGRPGHEFTLRIRNRTDGDILAVVSVDGVNVVSGESAGFEQRGYVVGPASYVDIAGWRKSLDRTAAFYFTEIDNAYATRTGRPDNVGSIGLAVFRRLAPVPQAAISPDRGDRREDAAGSPEPPRATMRRHDLADRAAAPSAAAGAVAPGSAEPDFARAQRDAGRMAESDNRLGTGHGRLETSLVRTVPFERATSTPEQVLTLFYDRRENLVARGVLPARRAPRYDPDPFPGAFCADPPGRG